MVSTKRMVALVKSCRWKEVESALRERSELIGCRDGTGRNWLHVCCGVPVRREGIRPASSIRTADVLLDMGIDINDPASTEGAWKATPLWYAISRG